MPIIELHLHTTLDSNDSDAMNPRSTRLIALQALVCETGYTAIVQGLEFLISIKHLLAPCSAHDGSPGGGSFRLKDAVESRCKKLPNPMT